MREAEFLSKTVYNINEEERLELVKDYHKYSTVFHCMFWTNLSPGTSPH